MPITNNQPSHNETGAQKVPPDTRIPDNMDDPRDRLPVEDDPPVDQENPGEPKYFRDRNRDFLPGPEAPQGIDTPTDPDREYPVDEGPLESPPMGDDAMDSNANGFSQNRSKDIESNVPNI